MALAAVALAGGAIFDAQKREAREPSGYPIQPETGLWLEHWAAREPEPMQAADGRQVYSALVEAASHEGYVEEEIMQESLDCGGPAPSLATPWERAYAGCFDWVDRNFHGGMLRYSGEMPLFQPRRVRLNYLKGPHGGRLIIGEVFRHSIGGALRVDIFHEPGDGEDARLLGEVLRAVPGHLPVKVRENNEVFRDWRFVVARHGKGAATVRGVEDSEVY